MDEEDGAPYAGGEVDVREPVAREGAPALEDYSVDGEEGGVEDEACDCVALLGGAGGEVAGGAGTEGSAVEYDGGGGDLEDRGEIGVGCRDVREAVVFGGVSCCSLKMGEALLSTTWCTARQGKAINQNIIHPPPNSDNPALSP